MSKRSAVKTITVELNVEAMEAFATKLMKIARSIQSEAVSLHDTVEYAKHPKKYLKAKTKTPKGETP